MKAIFEFSLPEDHDEHRAALYGQQYKDAIEEIYQQVFRPLHKHGYGNEELRALTEIEDVRRAIELLSEIYRKITIELPE